jgi:hypothetical protein
MKYGFFIIGLALPQILFCQKYLLNRDKLDPPNSVVIFKAVGIKDSTSFLTVQVTRLDTLKDEKEKKIYQLYHLEIGNFSQSSVCIPVAHFGNHLYRETVLVLENPYDEKVDFVTLEDCYHDGYSHVCPSNLVVINPNTYFKVSFALDVSQSQFLNVHFDYAVLPDGYVVIQKAEMQKSDKWKNDLKFICRTIKLPK